MINRQQIRTLILLLVAGLTVACGGGVAKKAVKTTREAADFTGVASWYGPGFQGRRTASGERFNMNALTAAHRELPFGTQLKVTHLENGKSITVTVNDRGPFIKGRVLDLSREAAKQIGMLGSGHAAVEARVIESPNSRVKNKDQAGKKADS